MWPKSKPCTLKTGENSGFYWAQLQGIVDEVLETCPEILKSKWVAMTRFDSSFLVPYGESKGTAPDVWMGEPKLVDNLQDLPWSGHDEFLVFDYEPDIDAINKLKDFHEGTRFSEEHWRQLEGCGATSYFVDDIFLATKNKELIARFLQSDFVRDLPEWHHRQNAAELAHWLEQATTDAVCAKPDCGQNAVVQGVNCPRHHFEMLYGEPFPDELL